MAMVDVRQAGYDEAVFDLLAAARKGRALAEQTAFWAGDETSDEYRQIASELDRLIVRAEVADRLRQEGGNGRK